MEWETRAKQKNAELVKLNTTTHKGFYVVYYYTYITILHPTWSWIKVGLKLLLLVFSCFSIVVSQHSLVPSAASQPEPGQSA